MKRIFVFIIKAFLLSTLIAASSPALRAQAKVASVEITGPATEAVAGQKMNLTATAKDETGKTLDVKPSFWVALPVDSAAADETGTVTFLEPGEIKVVAIVGGKPGFAKVNVKPASVSQIDVEPATAQVLVGGTLKLNATARVPNGDPRSDVAVTWASDTPRVATVDAAGFVTGVAPGKATVRASVGSLNKIVMVQVVANPVRSLSVVPSTTTAKTGDVVHFVARAKNLRGGDVENPSVRWAVTGDGAIVYPDGGFVAERPGSYIVTAASGNQSSSASIVVSPRNVARDLKVVSHALLPDVQAAEQWIFGNYAYVSTISDRLFVYDISDSAKPKLTDTVKVDAHIINDISVTPDGKIGVLTREGASNRKNGIMFLDTSDPAHPKVISEYTETVTGGVHSGYIDGHYVYITDDATGSLRVIDFADVKHPKEVARWQVENPLVGNGGIEGGRYLHDVQVKDGLAYLAYWKDGLVILDVGNGIKGGSPEHPQFVSQYRFNYHDLYGNGWMAGAHAVFRYKNYVFVGDEVVPEQFDINSKNRILTRGVVHVVDVSDITHPRKVAEYAVPEAGSHNIWVLDDVLYMGYYNGGGRVLDVSGELRGDLYRQGREIAHLWTGSPEGFRTNQPLTWGAQPHNGLVFFNDINSGLWITRLGGPRSDTGSTTEPGR